MLTYFSPLRAPHGSQRQVPCQFAAASVQFRHDTCLRLQVVHQTFHPMLFTHSAMQTSLRQQIYSFRLSNRSLRGRFARPHLFQYLRERSVKGISGHQRRIHEQGMHKATQNAFNMVPSCLESAATACHRPTCNPTTRTGSEHSRQLKASRDAPSPQVLTSPI